MAFPGTYNFNYYRGDTAQMVIRPKTANGSAFNLTGYTAEYTLADSRNNGSPQYSAGITAVVNTVSNIVTATITPTGGRALEAGSYVYDIQITNGIEIYTVLTGVITVTNDITGA
jgi:hypothetical protein